MFLNNDPTSVAAIPAPNPVTNPGYFAQQPPGSANPGTVLTPDCMNMILAELLNILTVANITPEQNNNIQVLQALAVLFTTPGQFGASLNTNGYQKLPSGLIIQWGTGTTPSNGVLQVTWPISFPNGVFQPLVIIGSANGPAANNYIVSSGIPNTTGNFFFVGNGSGTGIGSVGVNWFALGH